MSEPLVVMQPDEFDAMLPKPVSVIVYSRRQNLEVWPIQLPDIKRVMGACGQLITQLKELKFTDHEAVKALLMSHIEDLPDMLSACLGKPIEYFNGGTDAYPRMLQIDEFINLAMAVLRLNLDFFIQRVFPSALPAVALLVARQPKPVRPVGVRVTPNGRGRSKNLSPTATDSPTSNTTAGDNSSDS